MTPNKLLFALSRPEVTAVILQAGKPPTAVVSGVKRPLAQTVLTEDELIALLAALSGREHLLGLPDGRSWKHEAAVGTVQVRAGYDGSVLKAAMKLTARIADRAAEPAPREAAAKHARPQREPSIKPPKREPSIKPPKREPSIKPPKREPSIKPPKREPSIRPPKREPSMKPPRAPSVRPKRSSKRPLAVDMLSMPPAALERPVTIALPAADSQPIAPALPPLASISPAPASPSPVPEPAAQAEDGPAMSLREAFAFEPTSKPWAMQLPVVQAEEPAPVLMKFEGDALDDLLGKARTLGATDLHVVADRPPMLRLAGELAQQEYTVSAEQAEALIVARVPPALRAALERDGSCDFALMHEAYGRFRANVTRQRTGIKLTARPIGDHIPTLEELGLPESIARATEHHQGLIVITGPTGHGKTTTLNAIVGIINRQTRHHVITVEDPIEYVHPTARAVISQREVGTHTKSFQAALKGSLREDPDVIVVGELRDTETVRMALSASETGHLVISTMNTPSAAKTIDRLIDLFPPGDQPQVRMTLAGGLRLIVSQRLLPTADRTKLCAAAEILPGNMPLWNLIRENRTYQIASLQQRGKSLGIVRLDDSLAQLVRSGRTTLELAKPFAEQPEHFDALVRGKPIVQRPQEPQPGSAARAANQAAKAAAGAVAAATPKKAAELGKSMLTRAGKFFGGEG